MSENQTQVLDPVAAAVAAAQAAAIKMLNKQANSVATTEPSASTAMAPLRPGKPLGYDDLAAGNISVDMWIGVSEYGITFGQEKTLCPDEIEVEIDLNAVAYSRTIKFGNPATYLKSYDAVTCFSGGSWEDAIARAQRADPKARDYPSADLPMLLTHDVTVKDKVVAEEGTKLGNSLSTTNWANWKNFMDGLKAQGIGGIVRVKLGAQKRTNKNGNIWGVLTFTHVTD
jgi:hypothetical protein